MSTETEEMTTCKVCDRFMHKKNKNHCGRKSCKEQWDLAWRITKNDAEFIYYMSTIYGEVKVILSPLKVYSDT